MDSSVCRGCRRLMEENSGRDIFDEDSVITLFEQDELHNKKCIKLYSGIELITGQKVTKEEKLPPILCETCFQNVEAYVNFRLQLLKSREILLSSLQETKASANTKSTEPESLLALDTLISKNSINDKTKKLSEISLFQGEFSSSPFVSKDISNSLLPKIIPEDLINVDESSTSLDVNSLLNDDEETEDSPNSRLQNDQENNNLNDSDNSTDDTTVTNTEQIDVKQPDHDIESEIDVCSGEDDDVLELDVQKRKNETVEICSSSESDIEVCDYEPIGKRGNYNTLSPPIRY